jgi:hypothetical protein
LTFIYTYDTTLRFTYENINVYTVKFWLICIHNFHKYLTKYDYIWLVWHNSRSLWLCPMISGIKCNVFICTHTYRYSWLYDLVPYIISHWFVIVPREDTTAALSRSVPSLFCLHSRRIAFVGRGILFPLFCFINYVSARNWHAESGGRAAVPRNCLCPFESFSSQACLCCSACGYSPCDGLIPRPGSMGLRNRKSHRDLTKGWWLQTSSRVYGTFVGTWRIRPCCMFTLRID